MITPQAQILVDERFKQAGITNKQVIDAFLKVPREEFVPREYRQEAYIDIALPIGQGQTISQPTLVCMMTQLLCLKGNEKVLEVGTGSGYQAAILSHLAKEVYTVEIIKSLYESAKNVFRRLGLKNVHPILGNGSVGLAKFAPYDVIIVTAGAIRIPKELMDQLKEGGRLVIPVGESQDNQTLKLVTKTNNMIDIADIEPVAFVPLIGKYQAG